MEVPEEKLMESLYATFGQPRAAGPSPVGAHFVSSRESEFALDSGRDASDDDHNVISLEEPIIIEHGLSPSHHAFAIVEYEKLLIARESHDRKREIRRNIKAELKAAARDSNRDLADETRIRQERHARELKAIEQEAKALKDRKLQEQREEDDREIRALQEEINQIQARIDVRSRGVSKVLAQKFQERKEFCNGVTQAILREAEVLVRHIGRERMLLATKLKRKLHDDTEEIVRKIADGAPAIETWLEDIEEMQEELLRK
jgi:hypothetical protein